MENENNKSRREFIKKLAYMPPAIATLTVLPAFQASGSGFGNTRPPIDRETFSRFGGNRPGIGPQGRGRGLGLRRDRDR